MRLNRRAALASAPALAVAVLAPTASASGNTTRSAQSTTSDCPSGECSEGSISSVEELDTAFEDLSALSDEEVAQLAKSSQESSEGAGELAPMAIPIAVPLLVNCALNCAWIFRDGVSESEVAMKMADAVVGCVGVPAGGAALIRVGRLIWKHRKKIAAALSAVGLTAAQLAPLYNAKRP